MGDDTENHSGKAGLNAQSDLPAVIEEQGTETACESSCCGTKLASTRTGKATNSSDARTVTAITDEHCPQSNKSASLQACALGLDSCCDEPTTGTCCTDDCALAFAQHECDLPVGHDSQQLQPAVNGTTTHLAVKDNGSDQHRDRLRAAFDKYAAMIQNAICLCRNVPSSNVVRCCARTGSGGSNGPALQDANMTRQHRPSKAGAERNQSLKNATTSKEGIGCKGACCESHATEVQEMGNRRSSGCKGSWKSLANAATQCQQERTTSDIDLGKNRLIPGTVVIEDHKPDGITHDHHRSCCTDTSTARAGAVQSTTSIEALDGCKQNRCTVAMIGRPGNTSCEQSEFPLSQESDCCNGSPCEIAQSGIESRVDEYACQDFCLGSKPGPSFNQITSVQPTHKTDINVESGAQSQDVVINVQGMTCTGCENKLATALEAIVGVSQVRVVFVSGRAEFKFDTSITSIGPILSQVQAHTGFQISQAHTDLASLDFLVPKHVPIPVAEKLPPGANDIELVSSRLVRVFYDPSRIQARPLVAALESQHVVLAPTSNAVKDSNETHIANLVVKTLFAIGLTIPVCVLAWADLELSEHVKGATSLALATLVQGIAISEFYWNAFRSLYRNRILELDMLIVISITAAYAYSVIAFGFLIAGRPLAVEEFFETSTLLISLVLLGRLITGFARARAVASVSLRSYQNTSITILIEDGSEKEIDSRLLHFGDVFKVPPHTRIATDGTIVSGESEIDESVVTGESIPVMRGPDSSVLAGSMNGYGLLNVKVHRLPGKNTLTDIAELVEAAQSSKPRVQSLADTLAGFFIPVVLTIALIVFVVWIPISIHLRGLVAADAVVSAVTYTVAVLAVSCPCALGLAVPMVLVITGGIAARNGIIIKSASATERAWSITDVVFDKTGTLTLENLEVCHAEILNNQERIAFPATLALSKDSNHPVARSVATYLSSMSVKSLDLPGCRSLLGKGIESEYHDTLVRLGNPEWLHIGDHPVVKRFHSQQYTVLCTTRNDDILAIFALRSTIRPEAHSVLSQLHARGLTTHLLSGDTDFAVQQVGHALNIKNVRSRQSPRDKGTYIDALVSDSKRRVLFCGDGTNDAVAIARAHVGVSMGVASDVTAGSADVTLLGSLEGVVGLLDLSKAAFRRIVFNFVWSGVYNVCAILLASGALVVVRLPPAYAGLGELVSVLPVIAVAGTMLLRTQKL